MFSSSRHTSLINRATFHDVWFTSYNPKRTSCRPMAEDLQFSFLPIRAEALETPEKFDLVEQSLNALSKTLGWGQGKSAPGL